MIFKQQVKWQILFAFGVLLLALVNLKAAFILAIFGLAGFAALFYRDGKIDDFSDNPLNAEAIKKCRENLDKIIKLALQHSQLTNDIVQQSLKVSDATATRYLKYLTDLGKLIRVNERGREVYYKLPIK